LAARADLIQVIAHARATPKPRTVPADLATDMVRGDAMMTMHDLTSFGRQQTQLPAFEPFPFTGFRREMGRLFDDFFRTPAFGGFTPFSGVFANWPVLQVNDLESEVIVTAEVPGLTDKDIELFFDKGVLILRGVKDEEKNESGYSELFHGRFERQVPLPYSIDFKSCVAEVRDGLLTVHLPKLAEIENDKRIPINVTTRH
jgi:HSP20 family protein